MIKTLLVPVAMAGLLAAALPANAALVVNTGTPNGSAIGSYTLDSMDWYAGEVQFAASSQINSIFGHILGGAAGETFHVSLYADSGSLPGQLKYTSSASFGSNGWNGVAGLSGWTVNAGTYWVGLEVTDSDTLGSSSVTGALLDQGAPSPLIKTAFSSTGGTDYSLTSPNPLSIGLQLDASPVSAVPVPHSTPLLLCGLLMLAGTTVMRRRDYF